MLIKRKRFSESEQKEFGARERKQKRKVARAEQNAEMHANKAANKAKRAVAAEKQVPANVSSQKPVAEVVNSIKNTTKEGVKNAGRLLRKNKKAVAIGAGVAATGAGLAAMIKKNKD